MLDVVIIGSGFSGIGMAIALRREGKRSFVVLEKGPGPGGTWRENTYPGCACDVPSHLYSFSFAPNPRWTRRFAPQPEILDYLERCADEVRADCRFGVEVTGCSFDEASATWEVRTTQGEPLRARHVVMAVGALHHPKFPAVPGRETFEGQQLHSAAWDARVELAGKRVVVVGTGASAIQVVPALVPKVAQLTLIQRTPAWVIPRDDAPISRLARWLYRVAPWLMKLTRARIYMRLESRGLAFTRWPRVLKAAEWLGKRHLAAQVGNPALRTKLTPTYAAGCKRVLLSDDYYPAFNEPHVTLENAGVQAVTAQGVVTTEGRLVRCDVIAWCTGFDVAAPLARLEVVGRAGRELARDAWANGLRAYRGTTVPGFPNLFLLMGPNTGLGHNSMVYMIESQVHFVLEHLRALDASGAKTVEVKEAAESAFNETLAARLPGTIWATGCSSWYLDEAGRNVMLWPGSTGAFRALTSKVDPDDVRFGR